MHLLIKCQPPDPGVRIVANDIDPFVISQDFKIAVIRIQPAIEDFSDFNFAGFKTDETRSLFGPVSRVTIHINFDDRGFHFWPPFICRQLKITTTYAAMAHPKMKDSPKISAIWADTIAVITEAHPFADQA